VPRGEGRGGDGECRFAAEGVDKCRRKPIKGKLLGLYSLDRGISG